MENGNQKWKMSVPLLPHPSCSLGHRIRHLCFVFLFLSGAGILLHAGLDILSHPLILLVFVLAVLLPAIFRVLRSINQYQYQQQQAVISSQPNDVKRRLLSKGRLLT